MSLDLLKDDIKNNRIRKLYLFHGPEQYLSKHYLGVVEKALIAEDLKVLNRVMLEGKADQGVIINNCETMPVFSEKRIVIVKNSGLFKASKKQAAALDNTAGNEETTASEGETTGKAIETGSRKKAGAEKKTDDSFPEYLAGLPEHVCLIFLENEIDKRLKIVDAIKKAGLVVEFAFQKPDELERWITRIFKASGKEISSDTAAVMINGCEPGMTEIMNEIEKLKSFIGEKTTVSISDIEKVCTKSIKGRVFDITDAIAVKNCTRALKLLNDMIILKEPVQKIFFMMTRQLRQLLQVKILKNKGCGQDEIAKQMGIAPFIAAKLLKQAASFSETRLKKLMELSLELDVAVKTGKIKDEAAAELLIISMSE